MPDRVVALQSPSHLDVEAATLAGPLASARARLRILFASGIRLGPGKIDLLEAIAATGSITAGARSMGMSYRRAWVLIDETNRLFKRPVVLTAAGGVGGGGAELSPFGRALIAAYRRIETRTLEAMAEELAPFESDLAVPVAARAPLDVDAEA